YGPTRAFRRSSLRARRRSAPTNFIRDRVRPGLITVGVGWEMLGQHGAYALDRREQAGAIVAGAKSLGQLARHLIPQRLRRALVHALIAEDRELAILDRDVEQPPVAMPRLGEPELVHQRARARHGVAAWAAGLDVHLDLARRARLGHADALDHL